MGLSPVFCDLKTINAVHLEGCEVVIHCAAFVAPWGTREEFWEGNVEGTRHMLAVAKEAGVKRFIQMSTEAVILDGQNVVDINESYPYPEKTPFLYSETKAEAEKLAIAANEDRVFEVIVLRPRFVWGPGDTTILASLVAMVDNGKYAWIGQGKARTSTCHIDNLVHATTLVLENGTPGGIYFITDDEVHTFREFLTVLLKTQGRNPGTRNVPGWFVRLAAWGFETLWKLLGLKSKPPATRFSAMVMTTDCVLNIRKAKEELSYQPIISMAQGLAGMKAISINQTGF